MNTKLNRGILLSICRGMLEKIKQCGSKYNIRFEIFIILVLFLYYYHHDYSSLSIVLCIFISFFIKCRNHDIVVHSFSLSISLSLSHSLSSFSRLFFSAPLHLIIFDTYTRTQTQMSNKQKSERFYFEIIWHFFFITCTNQK
jgi:hypothetical protein